MAQALSVVGNIGYSFIKTGLRPYVLMYSWVLGTFLVTLQVKIV